VIKGKVIGWEIVKSSYLKTVSAQYYDFTDEELDFIISYDIKYRMGRDTGEEE
jgi:hypothetical protein